MIEILQRNCSYCFILLPVKMFLLNKCFILLALGCIYVSQVLCICTCYLSDNDWLHQGIRGHPKTIKPFQQKSQDEILAKLLGMPTGSSTNCMVGVLSASRGIGVLSALKLTDFCLNNETPIFFLQCKDLTNFIKFFVRIFLNMRK